MHILLWNNRYLANHFSFHKSFSACCSELLKSFWMRLILLNLIFFSLLQAGVAQPDCTGQPCTVCVGNFCDCEGGYCSDCGPDAVNCTCEGLPCSDCPQCPCGCRGYL